MSVEIVFGLICVALMCAVIWANRKPKLEIAKIESYIEIFVLEQLLSGPKLLRDIVSWNPRGITEQEAAKLLERMWNRSLVFRTTRMSDSSLIYSIDRQGVRVLGEQDR
jgi:hypothetical protein